MHLQTNICNRNETYEETLLLQKLLLDTQIWQKPEKQKAHNGKWSKDSAKLSQQAS